MIKKKFYNEKEAMEHFGIPENDMYSAIKCGEIEVYSDESGDYFHWSDLAKFKILTKKEKQPSAKFGIRKAAKYLGISGNDLNCYTRLGWVKPIVFDNKRKVYSEADLDKFLVEILAPISESVNVFSIREVKELMRF